MQKICVHTNEQIKKTHTKVENRGTGKKKNLITNHLQSINIIDLIFV